MTTLQEDWPSIGSYGSLKGDGESDGETYGFFNDRLSSAK